MKDNIVREMNEFLKEHEYKLGVFGMSPIAHKIGLPGRKYSLVKPEYSPVDGACTVMITPVSISKYTIKIPYMNNEWILNKKHTYKDKIELLELLNKYTIEPKGAWG